jgi:hypothetical protein
MPNVILLTDSGSSAAKAYKASFARSAGAYRLATELRKHNYSVQVVDHLAYFTEPTLSLLKEVLVKYMSCDTMIIGVSSTFLFSLDPKKPRPMCYFFPDELIELKKLIQEISPKCKLVLGGARADVTREVPGFDAVIVGYADASLIDYLKFLEGKNPFFQFKIDNGVAIVDSDPKADSFDFNHSEIVWSKEDHITQGEVLPIEISRGCIFQCLFCNYQLNNKKKIDYIKDKEVIFAELLRNYEQHGVTKYIFSDDTFNDSTEKLEYLLEVFTRLPFQIKFAAYLRLDLIHAKPHIADLLLELGLESAIFGIETLNHKSGISIGKGLHPSKTKATLEMVHSKWVGRVATSSGFILGLPCETRSTLGDWLPYVMDPNQCPLDRVTLLPLSILQRDEKRFKSKLQVQFQEYGYQFDSRGHWFNADLTELEMVDLANFCMYDMKIQSRNKFAGFEILMMQNFGYTFEDLYGRSFESVSYVTLEQKHQLMFEHYHQQLLA